ncbi:TonB-dependent receptor plug domain-containing protein [Dyella mobilis]|uniref:TonB-dependent receptor n=1 Tax=Dyella mobilis TaxID=1849582 RepID=A0ABS2KN09_9GAMM|nr:TonB-dependent receptor [Dyella mobilis]MBM7132192.1 TonB-dependent receptor [Dyella mobilis]GLQ95823.1 TonB-dependent receptor [Dyella mobilis]
MKAQQRKLLYVLMVGALAGALGYTDTALAQSTDPTAAQTSGPSPQSAPAPQAQSANPQQTKTLQGVTVTGSLIRSVDVELAQPVVTITSQDIQRQGFATVGQLLANLTSASTPDISKSDPYEGGPDVGGTYIDLRNLGATRTLILLDGKRVGTSFDGLTNLDTIPTAIVDHIDVLADGASATYGSDAIGGVVNIVTKQNFNGGELDTYDGKYMPHGDGDQGQYSLLLGKTYAHGSIELAAQYQKQDALSAADRPYSAYPETSNYPLNNYVPFGSQGQYAVDGVTWNVLNNGGNPQNINDYHPLIQPSGVNGVITNPGDYVNINPLQSLMSATSMKNLFAQGHYDINSNITADFTASFNQQANTAQMAGFPLTSAGLFSQQYPQYTDMTLAPDSYYNPTNAAGQTPTALYFQRNVLEVPRLNVNKVENFRFSLGVEGNFSIGEHLFNWDAYYWDTRYQGTILNTGNFDLPNLSNALGASFQGANGAIQCGTPGDVIAGCVPLNVLAPQYSQAMLNYILVDSYEHYGSSEKGPQFDLSGDLVELPAGDLTFAVGASHRNLHGYDTPDLLSAEGLTTNLAGQPTAGGYNVSEGWLEVNVPILKDLPLVQSLSLDVADRFSHYSNFGGTNNRQFKVTWKPFDDLMIRGSYGTGFRAPTVGDLYGGVTTTYPGFSDPCDVVYGLARTNSTVAKNCANGIGGLPGLNQAALNAAGLGGEFPNGFMQETAPGATVTSAGGAGPVYAPFTQGGNPNLKPETSRSTQFGFVYSPSFFTGFNATVDYFHATVHNVISTIGDNQVLNNCYALGVLSDCQEFQRTQADNFQVSSLFMGEENQGWMNVAGYDVDLSYKLPKFSFGQFTLDSKSTYYTHNNSEQYLGAPVSYNNGLSSYWRLRSNFTIGWSFRDFGAQWTLRYYSPLKEPCYDAQSTAFPCTLPNYYMTGVGVVPVTQMPSVTFNDLQVYWNAPWNGTIALGANNIFNRVGPYSYGGFVVASVNNTDYQYNYNPSYDYGRFVYLRYTQKF